MECVTYYLCVYTCHKARVLKGKGWQAYDTVHSDNHLLVGTLRVNKEKVSKVER